MPISLKWTLTTEFPVKCFVLVLDYHAHSEIGEYTIHGPELRHAPGTRNFENCYVVSYTRSPASSRQGHNCQRARRRGTNFERGQDSGAAPLPFEGRALKQETL